MKTKLLTGLLVWWLIPVFGQQNLSSSDQKEELQRQLRLFDGMYDALDRAFRREKFLLNREEPIDDLKKLHYKRQTQNDMLGLMAKKYAAISPNKVSNTYTKALLLVEEKKIEEAIQVLVKAKIKDSPHLILLSELYALNLEFPRSAACALDLLQLDSMQAEHLLVNAKIQRFQKKFDSALQFCQKGLKTATALNLNTAYFSLEQSLIYLEQKDFTLALQHANAYLKLIEELIQQNPNDDALANKRHHAYNVLAKIHQAAHHDDLAIAAYQQQIKQAEQKLLSAGQKMIGLLNLAEANTSLRIFHTLKRDYEQALPFGQEALKNWEMVQREFPDNLYIKYFLAYTHDRIGRLYWELTDEKKAKEHLEAGNRIFIELDQVVPYITTFRYTYAESFEILGDYYTEFSDDPQYETHAYKSALFLYESLHLDWPHDHKIMGSLSWVHSALGDLHLEDEAYQKAFDQYAYSWELLERLVANYPDSLELVDDYGGIYLRLGLACTRMIGKSEKAIGYLNEGIKWRRQLLEKDPQAQDFMLDLAHAYLYLGENYSGWDNDAALEAFLDSKAFVEELRAKNPDDIDWDLELGEVLVALGNVYLKVNFKNKAQTCVEDIKKLLNNLKAKLEPCDYQELEIKWQKLKEKLAKKE